MNIHQVVDVWGDVPYTAAQQLTGNTQPAYDDDAAIYPKLITLLTEAVTDLNAATSALTPGTNSVMYTMATFATAKANLDQTGQYTSSAIIIALQ